MIRAAIIVAMCAPPLALADDSQANVTVDAPVHVTPVVATPDEYANRAGEEANLQTVEHRQGLWLHIGLGPSLGFAVGGNTGSGQGGSLHLMIGQVMRPTWVAFLALTGNAQQHEVMNERKINNYTTAQAGFQWWWKKSLFLRWAAGVGTYRCNQCEDPDEPTNPIRVDYQRTGVSGTFGVGFELVRAKGIVIGLEGSGISTLTTEGVPVSLGFHVFASVD